MKELNSVEMQNVSGAGLFSDAFSNAFGQVVTNTSESIGRLIDWGQVKKTATAWGSDLGSVIDGAIDSVVNSINDTVNSFFKFWFNK